LRVSLLHGVVSCWRVTAYPAVPTRQLLVSKQHRAGDRLPLVTAMLGLGRNARLGFIEYLGKKLVFWAERRHSWAR
jgi:hypothetical protein